MTLIKILQSTFLRRVEERKKMASRTRTNKNYAWRRMQDRENNKDIINSWAEGILILVKVYYNT